MSPTAARKATAGKPAPKPGAEAKPDSVPAIPGTGVAGKYTDDQLAAWMAEASEGLGDFTATIERKEKPPVEVTDADRAYVRKAQAATEKLPVGGWLESSVPTKIPREVAAKLLSQRFDVIYAASAELGFKARRKGADANSHKLLFRVNKPEAKPEAAAK